MFNLLNIRNSKRGFSISENRLPSPLTPPQVELKKGRGRKCAFTLAETLITLVIIGVIAAITVPTLITKYQKEQTVTRLKKAYSALAQTTQRAIADNGPIETWFVGTHGSGEDALTFYKHYMKPYLSISKDCELQTTGSCEFKYSYLNDNTIPSSFGSSHPRFFLQDGTFVTLFMYNNDNQYFQIHIDINGQKKPNKFGKDIFRFDYYIKHNGSSLVGKILPAGQQFQMSNLVNGVGDGACNRNATSRAGLCCTAVIVKSGWIIPDDYPW